MAQQHAATGQVIAAGPLGSQLSAAQSLTLVMDSDLQISRLVLAQGHYLKPHRVRQRLVIQCLEGQLVFETMGRVLTLTPGDLCHIAPEEEHAVRALTNASALLTLFGTHTDPSDNSGDIA
ncbi:AraC family ligand binding domain-containing protein [Rhodoferax sp. U2-2l]|uniref:cupin domain-containing protein n=1 Tax=Rhodoferax sp. U2-2l TaxID=2884000 RepID=UPI001D09DE3D|nr:cupin domain-containing protein [Rhodoferax sp. U2-2l]MCB8748704.1 AraC family ligand binding domain-containing protein [Rhodoferax sp. U2-2l]